MKQMFLGVRCRCKNEISMAYFGHKFRVLIGSKLSLVNNVLKHKFPEVDINMIENFRKQ